MRWILFAITISIFSFAITPPLDKPFPSGQQPISLKEGVFLVASPHLTDPYFYHSVVLLVKYGADGALGFIINKPTEISLAEALPEREDIKQLNLSLFFGGPVRRNLIFFLIHTENPVAMSEKVFDDVYFTGNIEAVINAIKARDVSHEKIRVYFGYAGWAPGQLEREINRGSWIIKRADPEIIFSKDPSRIWHLLIQEKRLIFYPIPLRK